MANAARAVCVVRAGGTKWRRRHWRNDTGLGGLVAFNRAANCAARAVGTVRAGRTGLARQRSTAAGQTIVATVRLAARVRGAGGRRLAQAADTLFADFALVRVRTSGSADAGHARRIVARAISSGVTARCHLWHAHFNAAGLGGAGEAVAAVVLVETAFFAGRRNTNGALVAPERRAGWRGGWQARSTIGVRAACAHLRIGHTFVEGRRSRRAVAHLACGAGDAGWRVGAADAGARGGDADRKLLLWATGRITILNDVGFRALEVAAVEGGTFGCAVFLRKAFNARLGLLFTEEQAVSVVFAVCIRRAGVVAHDTGELNAGALFAVRVPEALDAEV